MSYSLSSPSSSPPSSYCQDPNCTLATALEHHSQYPIVVLHRVENEEKEEEEKEEEIVTEENQTKGEEEFTLRELVPIQRKQKEGKEEEFLLQERSEEKFFGSPNFSSSNFHPQNFSQEEEEEETRRRKERERREEEEIVRRVFKREVSIKRTATIKKRKEEEKRNKKESCSSAESEITAIIMKEKSKNAARTRREKENSEFTELSTLLPLPSPTTTNLDKASVIRLTTAYLKLRKFFPHGLGENWGARFSSIPEFDCYGSKFELSLELNKALGGFVFVVARDGKIMYISEAVSTHLGTSQSDIIGNSIYEYLYKDDWDEVERALTDPGSQEQRTGVYNPNESSLSPEQIRLLSEPPFIHHIDSYHLNEHNGHTNGHDDGIDIHRMNLPPEEVTVVKSFPVRMKCILAKRNAGLTTTLDQSTYKVIHCSGYLKLKRLREMDPQICDSPNGSNGQSEVVTLGSLGKYQVMGIAAVAHSFPSSAITEIKMFNSMFMSRCNLDYTIVFVDPTRITALLGYEPNEMVGHSIYKHVHVSDQEHIRNCHLNLMTKEQVTSKYYRFLCKGGGYVWMQSYSTVVHSPRSSRKDSIVSVNYVLSSVQEMDTQFNWLDERPNGLDSYHTNVDHWSPVKSSGDSNHGSHMDYNGSLSPGDAHNGGIIYNSHPIDTIGNSVSDHSFRGHFDHQTYDHNSGSQILLLDENGQVVNGHFTIGSNTDGNVSSQECGSDEQVQGNNNNPSASSPPPSIPSTSPMSIPGLISHKVTSQLELSYIGESNNSVLKVSRTGQGKRGRKPGAAGTRRKPPKVTQEGMRRRYSSSCINPGVRLLTTVPTTTTTIHGSDYHGPPNSVFGSIFNGSSDNGSNSTSDRIGNKEQNEQQQPGNNTKQPEPEAVNGNCGNEPFDSSSSNRLSRNGKHFHSVTGNSNNSSRRGGRRRTRGIRAHSWSNVPATTSPPPPTIMMAVNLNKGDNEQEENEVGSHRRGAGKGMDSILNCDLEVPEQVSRGIICSSSMEEPDEIDSPIVPPPQMQMYHCSWDQRRFTPHSFPCYLSCGKEEGVMPVSTMVEGREGAEGMCQSEEGARREQQERESVPIMDAAPSPNSANAALHYLTTTEPVPVPLSPPGHILHHQSSPPTVPLYHHSGYHHHQTTPVLSSYHQPPPPLPSSMYHYQNHPSALQPLYHHYPAQYQSIVQPLYHHYDYGHEEHNDEENGQVQVAYVESSNGLRVVQEEAEEEEEATPQMEQESEGRRRSESEENGEGNGHVSISHHPSCCSTAPSNDSSVVVSFTTTTTTVQSHGQTVLVHGTCPISTSSIGEEKDESEREQRRTVLRDERRTSAGTPSGHVTIVNPTLHPHPHHGIINQQQHPTSSSASSQTLHPSGQSLYLEYLE